MSTPGLAELCGICTYICFMSAFCFLVHSSKKAELSSQSWWDACLGIQPFLFDQRQFFDMVLNELSKN